jgi:hypothetical protein
MDITKIPGIMRHHNWTNGARLMEAWFARPVTVKPAYGQPPVFVTMDWALGFSPVKSKYDEIVREKIWANPAARRELRRQLQRKGLLRQGACTQFGDLSKTAPNLEDDYINFRAVGGYVYQYYSYHGLNDLTAALGRFVMNVAISGVVESIPNLTEFKISVSEVGIYIKDSYDFEGDQFLGYWDENDNSVSTINRFSGDGVSNEDFRNWRTANGKGGDFRVYSDVKRQRLGTADKFNI